MESGVEEVKEMMNRGRKGKEAAVKLRWKRLIWALTSLLRYS